MVGSGYLSMRMKRKEIDEINDDFSDFSLSSPARKIRRLDAELPPIMEEEEHEIPLIYEPVVPAKQVSGAPVIEELSSDPINEERAIVLFKPLNNPPLHSFPNLSVSVDSDIISGFKNQFIWPSNSGSTNLANDEEAMWDRNNAATNELAVVPWVPFQFPSIPNMEVPQTDAPELMESDEMGEATMDIEDSNDASIDQGHAYEFEGMRGIESPHQWQQQHCMPPQLPQNKSTPITWFR